MKPVPWNMKLVPLPGAKVDKRNKTMSKKIDNDVISANCDVIVIFPIYEQFGAIRKSDSGGIVCKTYIFINSNLLSWQNWKLCNTALTLSLLIFRKRVSGTNFCTTFYVWFFKKSISHFYSLIKFHCLVAFTFSDIGQYMYCNYFMSSL